jgi:DNA invertase Pin-like site-specific DNA recombinase
LIDSKVKFKAVDNPHATELTIHILSAVAQDEAKRISKRIKEALAIKRIVLAKENKKLGSPLNLTPEARKRGYEAVKDKAIRNSNNVRALAFVKELDYQNLKLRELAKKLNDNNFKTSTGKDFSTTQVIRIISKIKSTI